jgi:hypothetical protein
MKLNATQSNLSAFKIGKQLFFFDIKKVVAHIDKTDGRSEIKWLIGLPLTLHDWIEDVRYSDFGTTKLKDIALKANIPNQFYIHKKHTFEVFVNETDAEVMLDLSKVNDDYRIEITTELEQSIKAKLTINTLPKDFAVYDLDTVTQDIFNIVQSELLENPALAQTLKIKIDTENQHLNAFYVDDHFLYSSNYAVCAELYQNGRDVNVKFSFGNFIDDFSKIDPSDKYYFAEINLPNVKIKSKETYSVSAEQVELNTLMTERVSDEYAFLGAFYNDLFEYYQMLIYREDDAKCIKSVIGKQYNDEYFVIDLNEVIGDILDVVNEHAVEPF